MGSSRASTPAGRKRASRRTAVRGAAGGHRAAPKPPAKKSAPKRAPAKTRKAPKAAAKPKPRPKPKKAAVGRRAALRARAPRLIAWAGVILAILAAGYQFWFRDSSLVAVEDVSVAGIAGPESEQATAALKKAAGEMSTLNVDEDALEAAVAGFGTVAGISADADFPHGLAIEVDERPPVMLATAGGQELPVASDGTVLPGVDVGEEKLPKVAVEELPAQGRLEGDALAIALVLGAAPEPLRPLIDEVTFAEPEGVQVTLGGDVPVYFGGSEAAREKWNAVAAILANPRIDTLTYVDVRVADRPAVGGAAEAATTDTTTQVGASTTPTTVP